MNLPPDAICFLALGLVALVFAAYEVYSKTIPDKARPSSWLRLLIWASVGAYFYGGRALAGDTEMYSYQFSSIINNGFQWQGEWGFDGLVLVLENIGLTSDQGKFTVISFLISFLLGSACLVLFGNRGWLALGGMSSTFSFYSIQSVTIRQGLSIGLLFASLALFINAKKKFTPGGIFTLVFVNLLAFSFHTTALIFISAAGGAWILRKKPKAGWIIFIITTALSIADFNILTVGPLQAFTEKLREGHFEMYLNSDNLSYRTDFRWDFWLYITTFVAAGTWIYDKGRERGDVWGFTLSLHLLLCSLFVLFFCMPFSDRIGMFAFLFAPLSITMLAVGTPNFGVARPRGGLALLIGAGMLTFSFTYYGFFKG